MSAKGAKVQWTASSMICTEGSEECLGSTVPNVMSPTTRATYIRKTPNERRGTAAGRLEILEAGEL